MNDTQKRLMKQVQMYSFALTEAVLYLDTHPHDTAALNYYEKYRKLRKEAIRKYEENFGPITAENIHPEKSWSWVLEPWPWELKESSGKSCGGRR